MTLDRLIRAFEQGDHQEKCASAYAIAFKLNDMNAVEYHGMRLKRSDWLTYALAYAPDIRTMAKISQMIASMPTTNTFSIESARECTVFQEREIVHEQ